MCGWKTIDINIYIFHDPTNSFQMTFITNLLWMISLYKLGSHNFAFLIIGNMLKIGIIFIIRYSQVFSTWPLNYN